MPRVKFGARLIRAFVYGLLVGVVTTMLTAIAGGVLVGLGFDVIPKSLYPAIGFIFGFAAPFAIEISKEMEEASQ